MGRITFNTGGYQTATRSLGVPARDVTRAAEREFRDTGRLDPLVDPAGFGLIRRSLMRFEQRPDGLYVVTVGTPIPVETRLDTTGSMGGFVDIAMRKLEKLYLLTQGMLPGRDLQIATGIFGDCIDPVVLCRPQFEMEPEKIVYQLTLMTPQWGGGGNGGEDPHYGIFGGAYLVDSYANRIGLKGYDFTVTDEPARYRLDVRQLIRIYGTDVFDKVAENGHEIDQSHLPSTEEVVQALLKRAHGFALVIDPGSYYSRGTTQFWQDVYGPERVITLPDVDYLPHTQAIIVGLTEGTLNLEEVETFLMNNGVDAKSAKVLMRSVVNIPIGAQAALPNFYRQPVAGDVFATKTDLWPLSPDEVSALPLPSDDSFDPGNDIDWL